MSESLCSVPNLCIRLRTPSPKIIGKGKELPPQEVNKEGKDRFENILDIRLISVKYKAWFIIRRPDDE
jgi:hypothetical protein